MEESMISWLVDRRACWKYPSLNPSQIRLFDVPVFYVGIGELMGAVVSITHSACLTKIERIDCDC